MAQTGNHSNIVSKFETTADKVDSWFSNFYPALILILCVLNIKFLSYLVPDPDLFARLAVGKLIEQTGAVPLQDPFSFSPTKSIWMDHEWLSGVFFYQVYQWGGELGLILFKYLMVAATVAVLLRTQIFSSGQNKRVSWAWALITLIPCSYLWISSVRCQVFTYLFISILFYLLISTEKKQRSVQLWFIPPLFSIWTQLHGGFVLGLLLFSLWMIWSIYRKSFTWMLGIVFILTIAATFISPYGGVAFWLNIIEALSMSRPNIDEWGPISIVSYEGAIALLILLIFLTCRQFEPRGLSFVILGFVLGFIHYRLIALFYFFALIFGGAPRIGTSVKMSVRATTVVASFSVIFSAVLMIFNLITQQLRFDYSRYPVTALKWLKENKKEGRLLVDFTLGSYALWELYPNFLVSIDGRYEEVYEEKTVQTAMVALDPKDSRHTASFSTLSPDVVIHETKALPIWKINPIMKDWQLNYSDEHFSIWIKLND